MKKIKLFTVLLVTIIFTNCQINNEQNTIDGFITPHSYGLNLQVFDKNGKNMVDNFYLAEEATHGDSLRYDIINPPKVELSTPGTSFPRWTALETVVKTDKYLSASIDALIFTDAMGFADKLTFKLSSSLLFGDRNEHAIESEWELFKEGGWETVCKSVKFDGKSYPVAEDQSHQGYLVKIQLE